MQVSVENLGKLERKLTVRVPADQYESQVKARLAEVARSVRLKGFRPGKIPPKVIEQRFGPQVRGEAISELIRNSFNEAVGKENLRPAMSPEIEIEGDDTKPYALVSGGAVARRRLFVLIAAIGAFAVVVISSPLEARQSTTCTYEQKQSRDQLVVAYKARMA